MTDDNWTENAAKTVWKHKYNNLLQVLILPNRGVRPASRYIVIHYHPGPRGTVILQPSDHANSMVEARKKARMHMKHWNDPKKWQSDPDFGKRGKVG
jgi:hypothetical protein